jgi:opacity protein-like surface antigen
MCGSLYAPVAVRRLEVQTAGESPGARKLPSGARGQPAPVHYLRLVVASSDVQEGSEAANRLECRRVAHVGGIMKKALFVLAMFVFCIASWQSAMAAPAKATKSTKATKATKSDNAGLGLKRLGFDAGLVDPEGASSTLGFGVFADLGNLARDVRLSSHLGYWNKSEDSFGAEASVRDISLVARAEYMFHVSSPKVQPYAGAGLGLHFFHSKAAFGGFTAEDSATKLGLDLGGGVATPVSPNTNLFGELWYTVADVNQFSMKAGFSFRLNR